ncbi:hypothetical protein UA45_06305 [Morganella morganii]|uniref:Transmembrane protein n=1 Tax=Morganella morganii TaxID=582 RepID=A0A0D8LBB3_MORMO|nr:hypothetical protein UA45_06305 [Morganella morganii]
MIAFLKLIDKNFLVKHIRLKKWLYSLDVLKIKYHYDANDIFLLVDLKILYMFLCFFYFTQLITQMDLTSPDFDDVE